MKKNLTNMLNGILGVSVFISAFSSCASAVKNDLKSAREVTGLCLPYLGVSSDSAYIVWDSLRADGKKLASDYAVFLNEKKLPESARQNCERQNKNLAMYSKAFYEYYSKKRTSIEMVKTDISFYKLENLEPETKYSVKVVALNKRGRAIAFSEEISFVTGKIPASVLNVLDFGAKTGEKVTEIPADEKSRQILFDEISANTKAIQKAIDECPSGGTVLIPEGTFVCGSLHLKSNMTLKIEGVLFGSPFAGHYDFGFLLYDYYTDNRYYGLLNAEGVENLVICGKGTVDGNGWKYACKSGGNPYKAVVYSEEGDPLVSENSFNFEKYVKGGSKKVFDSGILAASCADSYLKSIGKRPDEADSSELGLAYATRSTLAILRHVKGLFISGLTFKNPANHMINILDSENISITGLTEMSYDCNNGDGIGIICSKNAYIWNNIIDTGDDSIVFSSGVGKSAFKSGQFGASDVKIFGNYIHHGHGGVAFGSHTALGIKNVQIRDNIFNHTDIPFRVKSAPANGGEVCYVEFFDNAAACCHDAFSLSTDYNDAGTVSKYGAAEKMAVFHDIKIYDSSVYKVSGNAIVIYAKKGAEPHKNIFFENIQFAGCPDYVKRPKLTNCENIVIK